MKLIENVALGGGHPDVVSLMTVAECGDVLFINGMDSPYTVMDRIDGPVLSLEGQTNQTFQEYIMTTVIDPDGIESPVMVRPGADYLHPVNNVALVKG